MKVRGESALVLTPQQAARAAEVFRAAVARHKSQKALAVALGVSQQAVSEACRGTVSLGLAALLAESMGVRVGEVVGERGMDLPSMLLDFSIEVKDYLRTKDPARKAAAEELYDRIVPLVPATDSRRPSLDSLRQILREPDHEPKPGPASVA